MNKKFKFFVLSALIVLGSLLFHGILAMDEQPNPIQDNKIGYATTFSAGVFLDAVEAPQKKRRISADESYLFEQCPGEIRLHILKYGAIGAIDDRTIGKLPVVCKGWQTLIKQHKIEIFTFAICEVFPVDQKTCKRFLNGKLIYKPDLNNDSSKIELQIADLANPLEATFDLSQCGDTGKYLTISTGYRKGKKLKNVNKAEIWFVPRFLVEKEINESASHFKAIFPRNWSDSVPVGISWTWGGLDEMDRYDYLTTQNMDVLSNNNLSTWSLWTHSVGGSRVMSSIGIVRADASEKAAWDFKLFFSVPG